MNVVLVRGVVTRDPDIRVLAGGLTLASFDVSVQPPEGTRSTVPVVVPVDERPSRAVPAAGDEVLVLGQVQRRFFRAGGATQSRTEVVAEQLVAAADRRRVRRLLSSASERLAAS